MAAKLQGKMESWHPPVDSLLCAESQNGRSSAFLLLVRKYIFYVLKIIEENTHGISVEQKGQLAQQVFLNIFHAMLHGDTHSDFKEWVKQHTIQEALEFCNKQSIAGNMPFTVDQLSKNIRSFSISAPHIQEAVNSVIPDLSFKERKALHLRIQDNLSIWTIAGIMNCTTDEIRTMLVNVREKIDRHLLHTLAEQSGRYYTQKLHPLDKSLLQRCLDDDLSSCEAHGTHFQSSLCSRSFQQAFERQSMVTAFLRKESPNEYQPLIVDRITTEIEKCSAPTRNVFGLSAREWVGVNAVLLVSTFINSIPL